MENTFGPSDQWKISDQQFQYEKVIGTTYKPVRDLSSQPRQIQVNIMQIWVEFAYQHGDPTWKLFKEDNFNPPPIKYHDSIHSPRDFPIQAPDLQWEQYWKDLKSGKLDQSVDNPLIQAV